MMVGVLSATDRRQEELAKLDFPSKVTAKGWARVGVRDHYGIDVPLLCLHSSHSTGCGDFYDLFPLVDWLKELDMDMLQLLPLNDTGQIPSPYSPLSFYALHPIYLSLENLPYLKQAPKVFLDILNDMKALNKTRRVDYYQVLEKKESFLKNYITHFKNKFDKNSTYLNFLQKASYWVTDYALYKVLVEHFGSGWAQWPKELLEPSNETLKKLKEKYAEEMVYYQVVQFLCFEQMEKVHSYANEKGVFLLGDLSFLGDLNSCEVWRHPQFFKIDKSVGMRPKPDYPEGQYWGLPPYNWQMIEESGDEMLLERIHTLSSIYDLYRLDTCLGYFMQYEIPINESPKKGSYVPQSKEKALQNGKRLLTSFIKEANLCIPYAEAYDFSPQMLELLKELGIARLTTFTETNTVHTKAKLLYSGKDLPVLDLFMLSNHDDLPLRRWWFENSEKATLIAKYYGWNYKQILTSEQQRALIQMVYEANSIFHINMLYDLLPGDLTWPPEEEGVNSPGTKSDKNWTYRFKLSVEELVASPKLRQYAAPKNYNSPQ